MFGTLGGPELILILLIALIVFGPRKLPEIGKTMGKMLMEFRRASNDFKRTLEDEVEAEKTREAASQLPETPEAPGAAPGDAAPGASASQAGAEAEPAGVGLPPALPDTAPRLQAAEGSVSRTPHPAVRTE